MNRRDLLSRTAGATMIIAGATVVGRRASFAREATPAAEQAAEFRTELRAAVADIRRLVHNLRPPALDELGLVGALRERATRYAAGGIYQTDAGQQHGDPRLVVNLVAPDDLPPLPAAVEVAVYRIVAEALANVAKHASAHNCRVHLEATDRLTLTIEDDGVGLAPNRVVGVGLLSMRERAEELGGSVMIESRADRGGIRLLVCLPLPLSVEG